MLSVIIPTHQSERALVETLGPLVAGATAGLVREVILADGGSRDDTAAVADVAGCRLLPSEGPLADRLRAAVVEARAPWLLFIRPGTVLENAWPADAGHFIHRTANRDQAAVFRRGQMRSPWREAFALLAASLGVRAHPKQGLLIAKRFYDCLGGHPKCADPEIGLLLRIGRSRTITLNSRALAEYT